MFSEMLNYYDQTDYIRDYNTETATDWIKQQDDTDFRTIRFSHNLNLNGRTSSNNLIYDYLRGLSNPKKGFKRLYL
jgi:hypothetical protein